MVDQNTTLTITGKVAYKDEITPAQAAEIIAFIEAKEDETRTLGKPHGQSRSDGKAPVKKVESARDALDVSGATTNPEKIVALGAYVLQDGGETFKVEDVKAAFRRARETAPANFSRDLDKAIASGWIGAGDAGEYFLTAKVDAVLDGDFKFPKGNAAARSRGASRKAATTSKAGKAVKPEVFAKIDVFPSTLEGVPPYSKMKSNKDKLLWSVKLAKSLGVVGLANKHIEWLTDHLGAGIPNAQIAAAFSSAQKAGYANKSTQEGTIRITEDGETYLADLLNSARSA